MRGSYKKRAANVRDRDQYGNTITLSHGVGRPRCTMLGNVFIIPKRQLPCFFVQNTQPLSNVRVSLYRINVHTGYTLIEVLVALAVLIAGFTALSTMTNHARRAAIAAEELSVAQLACQTRINEMLAGIRPVVAAFNESVPELDHWYMTTELFPATKPGLTTVRIQMHRERQPGDTGGFGGTNSFEITSWIDNTRLDPQLVQTLQRNPYSMMMGGMPQQNMFGPNTGMSGGMDLAAAMASSGMGMPSAIPGPTMYDMSGGMSQGGGLPMFDTTDSGSGPPPLSLGDDFGDMSTASSSFGQSRLGQSGQSGVPAPLDIPIAPLSGETAGTSTTETPSLDVPTSDVATTTTPDVSDATSSETDVTTDGMNVEGINELPDTENDESETSPESEVTP